MNFNPYEAHRRISARVRDVVNQALLEAARQKEEEARGLRLRVLRARQVASREGLKVVVPESCA